MIIKKKQEKEDLESLRKEIISNGGAVKESTKPKDEKLTWTNICVRIPTSLLNDVDKTVKKRFSVSRNGWILESIQEKLKETET